MWGTVDERGGPRVGFGAVQAHATVPTRRQEEVIVSAKVEEVIPSGLGETTAVPSVSAAIESEGDAVAGVGVSGAVAGGLKDRDRRRARTRPGRRRDFPRAPEGAG